MRRSLRKKVEPSGEADAVAKRIVRRRIRAAVTRADAALTHTYASGLPLGGSIDLRRRIRASGRTRSHSTHWVPTRARAGLPR